MRLRKGIMWDPVAGNDLCLLDHVSVNQHPHCDTRLWFYQMLPCRKLGVRVTDFTLLVNLHLSFLRMRKKSVGQSNLKS